MAFIGAFGLLTNGTFSHHRIQRGKRNQTTGARGSTTRTINAAVKGALDPLTEEELAAMGGAAAQFTSGQFRFYTEESYGIRVGDIIIDEAGRKFRVLDLINTAPLVRKIMGHSADPIGFRLESTREGRE